MAYDDLAAALATFNETGSGGGEEGEGEREGDEEEGSSSSRRSSGGAEPSPSSSSAAPPKKNAGGSGKGDVWLARLARRNPGLALRVMEVRAAYAADDFEWDQCRRLATEGLAVSANLDILKARLGSAWAAGEASSSSEEE